MPENSLQGSLRMSRGVSWESLGFAAMFGYFIIKVYARTAVDVTNRMLGRINKQCR